MLNSRKKKCQYFNSVSGCRLGTKCKFEHLVTTSDTNTASIDEDEAVKTLAQTQPKVESFLDKATSVDAGHPTENEDETQPKLQNICFAYKNRGWCHYGKRCKYLHLDVPKAKDAEYNLPTEELSSVVLTDNSQKQNDGERRRVCIYFQQGRCWNGNQCKFLHPQRERHFQGKDRRNVSKQKNLSVGTRREVQAPQNKMVLKREDVNPEELSKLRKVDSDVIKRRFGKKNMTVIVESDNENIFEVDFSPSDPDWPFDAKVFKLIINFPGNYPMKLFSVSLPVEQDLPETVRRYVEVSIQEWLTDKQKEYEESGKVEAIFRNFMKWLDRALEDLVTEGLKQLKREMLAKAAGLTFVPVSQLRKEVIGSKSDDDKSDGSCSTDEDEEDSEESDPEPFLRVYRKKENVDNEVYMYTGPERNEEQSDDDEEEDEEGYGAPMEDGNPNSVRRGTEIRLKNLNMKENVASIEYLGIKIIIQCARCKTSTELDTPVGRVNMIDCSKCHQMQLLTFRPSLIHQFSSIVGYLDLDGCVPFDLVLPDCAFKVTCLSCNKETKAEGIYPGQGQDIFCRSCHQKLRVEAESVKFFHIGDSKFSTDGDIHEVPTRKIKKINKDPVIQLGKPLPDEGTCKHYKKSFRWFRFPCCGKAYACDICHEEKEQHEMVLANRMICGFCCKEQPFALDKPCSGCDSSLTKARTTHWEGGKGCRDKIKMCRNDVKKYTSMNKTKSRKAQEKKDPKKKTKLRHSSN